MKRINLALMFILVVLPAFAGWVKISEGVAVTVYVDPTTVRKSGGSTKAWYLYDYKENNGDQATGAYFSTKNQSEFNCIEATRRDLYSLFLAENMGAGKVVGTVSEPTKQRPIVPGSVIEPVFKYVCK